LNVYFYKYSNIYIYYIFFSKFFNINNFFWNNNNKQDINSIDFPPSNKYFELLKESRLHLESYFCEYIDKKINDKILRDYIIKSIMHNFSDYYYFRISVKESFNQKDRIKIISPRYLEDIYENKKPKINITKLFIYLFYFTRLFLSICKKYFFLMFNNAQTNEPDVLYLRKKVYPDMLDFKYINKKFSESGLSFMPSYMVSSTNSFQKYNINFLNYFKNYRKNFFKTTCAVFKISVRDFHFFLYSSFHFKLFSYFLSDLFKAISIINVNSKVFFGIFTDKPVFTLLYRHKKNNQIMSTITDGFTFNPILGADYCYSNYYFSMNDIESSTVNHFGGKLNHIIKVGSLRGRTVSSSTISESLKKLIISHNYVITITSSQILLDNYSEYNQNELKNMIKKIIEIAYKEKNILFILKEKKGEISSIIEQLNTKEISNNLFIIYSDKPRLLKENQFEDILKFTDLTISFAINSMTIIQSLLHNIPFIVFNESFDLKVWSPAKIFQSNSNNLDECILFWKKLTKKEKDSYLKPIKKKLNLNNNSIETIIYNTSSFFTENKI